MNLVILGNNCTPGLILRFFDLKQASLPFDWIEVKLFDNLLKIFEDEFKDFLNKKYLKHIKHDVIIETTVNTFDNTEVKNKTKVYLNEKYNIKFMHDFSNDISFNESYEEVYLKYNRRIKRLYDILKDNKPISFIFYYPDLTNEKITKLENILKGINKNINFKFYIITSNINIKGKEKYEILYIKKNVQNLTDYYNYQNIDLRNFLNFRYYII